MKRLAVTVVAALTAAATVAALITGLVQAALPLGPAGPSTGAGGLASATSPAPAPSPTPTALAGLTVLLMGDSLAAGEGGGNYLTGSDAERQRCHRSAAAWFAETAAEVTNVACSRATSQNLTVPQQDPQYNLRAEPAQLAATAGRAADITMVMVGGNDIRFAEIFNQCVLAENDCSSDPAFAARALRAAEALPATLARAYRAVAARTDGKAVLVPAYPQFFSESAAECGRISTAEAGLARELTAALNRSARQGAEDAAGTYPGVHFVADTEGALTGHGACDADPFVHTVLPTALIGAVQDPAAAQELLHPTAAGYGKLTEVLTRWLAKHPSVIIPAP